MVEKIISGAQTGADIAGLDAALHLKLAVGGMVPKGRRTNRGPLSDEQMKMYNLVEHPTSGLYPPRTMRNVIDSDATVIFGDMRSPGCTLTIGCCKNNNRPRLELPWDLLRNHNALAVAELKAFIVKFDIRILNVAGNREETNPGIYQVTFAVVVDALKVA